MKIKIIRHSERLDYTKPLQWLFYIGYYWSDSPLTLNGHEMARSKGQELAKEIDFDPRFIYTSPYIRTMETATSIQNSFPKAQIIIEPLLAEYQPYYKHTITLFPKGVPATYQGEETEFTYPETYEKHVDRVKFIIQKIIDKHDLRSTSVDISHDIIIVTHGEVIKTYAEYLLEIYPDTLLDIGNTPYLTTISFEYDTKLNKIIEESIKADYKIE